MMDQLNSDSRAATTGMCGPADRQSALKARLARFFNPDFRNAVLSGHIAGVSGLAKSQPSASPFPSMR